jgi:hypothetical protein
MTIKEPTALLLLLIGVVAGASAGAMYFWRSRRSKAYSMRPSSTPPPFLGRSRQ